VHDLVIANARIVDGLGARRAREPRVKDGRIAAVRRRPRRRRAPGRWGGLGPGARIIDLHTHYDAQLTWDAFATPSTALGVQPW